MENIPLTQASLLQHTKRAVYQAGHVWGSSLIAKPQIQPSPQEGAGEEKEVSGSRRGQFCHKRKNHVMS